MDLIKKITFSPLESREIKNGIRIEKNNNGSTVLGANIEVCDTCNRTIEGGCRGHGGKFQLKPYDVLIKPAYKKAIIKATKDYCLDCRFIKVKPEDIQNLLDQTINTIEIHNKCQNPLCKKRLYSSLILDEEKIVFKFTFKNSKEEITITPYEVFQMFSQCPGIIYKKLDKANPKEYFYYDYFYIPSNLIKSNNKLEKIIENDFIKGLQRVLKFISKDDIVEAQKLLFMFDNSKADSQYDNKNKSINISKEASGTSKNSILRENLLSSRQDNCYRSVVGSGDFIVSNEDNKRETIPPVTAYIPNSSYNNLLTYTTVNYYNKEYIDNLLVNTDKVSYIYKRIKNSNSGLKYTLINNKYIKYGKIYTINYGDIACIRGEPTLVFINRAPTLHIWNFQPFFAKNSNSFTTNINTTHANQYNMDFDGDTITGFVVKTATECLQSIEIFGSRHHISLSAVIGNIQDELVVLNKITYEDEIPPEKCFLYLGKYSYLYFRKYDTIKSISGRELVSLFFSKNMNYRDIIKNGILQKPLTSQLLTSRNPNSLVTLVYYENIDEYESYRLMSFFKEIASNLINFKSITFGYSDILLKEDRLRELFRIRDCMMDEFQLKYIQLMNDIKEGTIRDLKSDDIDRIITTNISIIQGYMSKELKSIIGEESMKDNSLAIMERAGYKVTVNDLINVFGTIGIQLNKGSIIKPKRQGRNYCIQSNNTLDLCDKGVFRKGFLEGIDSIGNFVNMLSQKSIPEVITVNCMTASTGFTGKTILRSVIDVVIDKYRRASDGIYLIQMFSGFLGVNQQVLCNIEVLEPNKNMVYYNELSSLWNTYRCSMIHLFNKRVKHSLFLINLDLTIGSFVSDTETPADKKDIVTLVNYINNRYYYNSFKSDYLMYTLLSYLDPWTLDTRYNKKLTRELLTTIKEKIDTVFFLYTTPGYGIGTAFANILQEKVTQNSLSNFHTTSKSGEAAYTSSTSSLEMMKALLSFNLSTAKKKKRIIKIFSQDKRLLSNIVNTFQLIDFNKLQGEVLDIQLARTEPKKIYTFNLKFNYKIVEDNFYNINDVTRLLVFYFESAIIKQKLTRYYLVPTDITNGFLSYSVQLESDCFYELILGLKTDGMTNRMYNNYYIPIVPESYYDPLGNPKEGFSISLYINSIKELESFDLHECQVNLDLYEQYKIYKRPGLKQMAKDTFAVAFGDTDKFEFFPAFTILINKLFGCSTLGNYKSISKTRVILSSTIDKSALVNSSTRLQTETLSNSVYGSLAGGIPLTRTSNLFPIYLDVSNLKRATVTNTKVPKHLTIDI